MHNIVTKKRLIVVSYIGLLFLTFVYSFALVDPNITFFQHSLWEQFRERMVYLGYYQRELSFYIYLAIILALFLFHFIFVKNYQKFSVIKLAFIIGGILLLSYPFLSHDFFNYMFDAKILTFYHQNPYLKKALDFPQDDWLRFMHWTHRTYPYGPVFLLITLVPSFLSLGKFILNFFFFKLLFVGFYILGVFTLSRQNKKWAILFATHPLVIIEGIVNSHNDLISLSLGFMGIYFITKSQRIFSKIFFILSIGIKYITLPIILLTHKKNIRQNLLVFILQLFLLIFISFKLEIQQWYFLTLFIFLPYFEGIITKLNLFMFGLLLSYYPYIYLGGWDTEDKVQMKRNIILFFLLLNGIYFIWLFLKNRRKYTVLLHEVLFSKGHT